MSNPPQVLLEDEIDKLLKELIHLWDSYCDEQNILEQYADRKSFLMHDKVKPTKQLLLTLATNLAREAMIQEYLDQCFPRSDHNDIRHGVYVGGNCLDDQIILDRIKTLQQERGNNENT